MSLPISVECAPYHLHVRMFVCVSRWREANGKTERTIAGIKLSHCRRCPVGEAREKEFTAGGGDVELKCPYCQEPRKRLERLPGGRWACRKCKTKGVKGEPKKAPASVSDAVIANAQKELTAAERFVEMATSRKSLDRKHVMERDVLAQRQREEAERADANIAAFEKENPDIRNAAKALIDG